MGCCAPSVALVDGASSGGGGSSGPWQELSFTPTTTDASVQSIPVAQLIDNADGNGVILQASFFALGRPITGPDQFSYDFWAYAARQGAGSGAVQYGDITPGAGAFVIPSASTSASHEVLINYGGLAGLTIDWIITVQIQSLRGAVIL